MNKLSINKLKLINE